MNTEHSAQAHFYEATLTPRPGSPTMTCDRSTNGAHKRDSDGDSKAIGGGAIPWMAL